MAEAIRVLELRSVRGTGGGPEKTILIGAARADRRRFQITVCYVRDKRDTIFDIDAKARAAGVEYAEIVERHSFDPSIWPPLCRLVRSRGIEIVHAHDYKTNLLALLLARRTPIVPVTTAHGWSGTSRRESLYYFFDRRLARRFAAVIAVSQEIRRTLIEHGARPEDVHWIRNGIDAAEFRRDDAARNRIRAELAIPDHATVIGSIGRLEPIKRFDLLLRAAAGLTTEPPPLVVIAGDGSQRAPLAGLAASLGIADRVRWLGHRDDVAQLHRALDLFVQSSDSEGVPNALLEAMAVETPVVATNVGGTRELIEPGVHGLLVPRGSAAALASSIDRALADPDDAARRARAARARVESELSFDRRAAAVEEIYLRLMRDSLHGASTPRVYVRDTSI